MQRPSSIWDQIALLVGFSDPSLIYTYELDYLNLYGFQKIDFDYRADDLEANIIMNSNFQSANQISKYLDDYDDSNSKTFTGFPMRQL